MKASQRQFTAYVLAVLGAKGGTLTPFAFFIDADDTVAGLERKGALDVLGLPRIAQDIVSTVVFRVYQELEGAFGSGKPITVAQAIQLAIGQGGPVVLMKCHVGDLSELPIFVACTMNEIDQALGLVWHERPQNLMPVYGLDTALYRKASGVWDKKVDMGGFQFAQ